MMNLQVNFAQVFIQITGYWTVCCYIDKRTRIISHLLLSDNMNLCFTSNIMSHNYSVSQLMYTLKNFGITNNRIERPKPKNSHGKFIFFS